MKMRVYSVFDRAALTYLGLEVAVNSFVAKRNFGNLMSQNSQDTLKRIGRDYELYEVGIFDTDSSELEDIVPVRIATGDEFIVKEREFTDDEI